MRFCLASAGALAPCLLTLAFGAVAAQAHHSMAMFDQTKKVTLSGTVRQFQWTNPHCYIQLMVTDAAGKTTEWSMEMGAPMYLYAQGWRPGTLKTGSKITLGIYPLRNGGAGGVVVDATTADGKPIGKKAS